MPTALSFFVPGKPRPQGSKRAVGPGVMVESSRHVGGWRERVALFARQAWGANPIAAPVQVEVTFYFVRPKAHYYTGRRAGVLRPDAAPYPTGLSTHGDVDKLLRAVLDGIAGVVVQDDKLVVTAFARKRFDAVDGARITVREIPAALPSESPGAPSPETPTSPLAVE